LSDKGLNYINFLIKEKKFDVQQNTTSLNYKVSPLYCATQKLFTIKFNDEK